VFIPCLGMVMAEDGKGAYALQPLSMSNR